MNPHAHIRLSVVLRAGFCGPVPSRLARWLGSRARHHKWRVARRAELPTANPIRLFELRVICERCDMRHAQLVTEAFLWELGIELPEKSKEIPK